MKNWPATLADLRQFSGEVFDITTVRDGNGLVQSISIEFKMSKGGRDLGVGLNAVSDLSGTLSNQTGVITVGTRGGAAEIVSEFEKVDLTIDSITAGWADVSAYLGDVTLKGSNQSDIFLVGANHRVDLGAGDDFLTVTGAGVFDNTSTYLQGGTGYDRFDCNGCIFDACGSSLAFATGTRAASEPRRV